jgi:hypothetical protein
MHGDAARLTAFVEELVDRFKVILLNIQAVLADVSGGFAENFIATLAIVDFQTHNRFPLAASACSCSQQQKDLYLFIVMGRKNLRA